MPWNTPNLLTLGRILLIPLFLIAYHLPLAWANELATTLFVLAAVTDWLDGYLARRLQQYSHFGAFLDPVADKLMVAAALVVILADPRIYGHVLFDERIFALIVLVILGREIAVSALREWMAELGKRASVKVTLLGKLKTVSQMLAIGFLIWREPLWGMPIFRIGEVLLYLAAGLTLWSMVIYLRAAWPSLVKPHTP